MFTRIALVALLWPGIAFGKVACTVGAAPSHLAATGLDGAFERAGQQFRIDPDLGRAMTWVESRFDANAVSPKGAQGLMQLMPGTSADMRVTDPLNAHQSIYGGMEYLRQIANNPRFVGHPYMVLVAYHAGPNRTVFPQVSYQYADHVVAVYWGLKAEHRHGLIAPIPIGFLKVPQCGYAVVHTNVRPVFLANGKLASTRMYHATLNHSYQIDSAAGGITP